MENNLLQAGNRVQVISYGPFRRLRGTILKVDTISIDSEEPFCFYLVALERAYIKEPVWFEYDEVESLSNYFHITSPQGM